MFSRQKAFSPRLPRGGTILTSFSPNHKTFEFKGIVFLGKGSLFFAKTIMSCRGYPETHFMVYLDEKGRYGFFEKILDFEKKFL